MKSGHNGGIFYGRWGSGVAISCHLNVCISTGFILSAQLKPFSILSEINNRRNIVTVTKCSLKII